MNPQIKQAKLREEWLNHGYWIGDSIDKDLVPDEVMNRMADFWLSKISQAKLETLEAIIKEVGGMRKGEYVNYHKEICDPTTCTVCAYNEGRHDGHGDGLKDLLHTLQAQKELIENEI